MDKDQIQQLAQQIADDTFREHWGYWLVLVVVTVTGIYFANRWSSYAKKRGEHDAVDADLKKILHHVEETTKVTEGIRSVVSLGEWSERERRTLRRLKLEELLLSAHRAREWLDQERNRMVNESEDGRGASPLPMMMSVGKLYFPELAVPLRDFNRSCDTYWELCNEIRTRIVSAQFKVFNAGTSLSAKENELFRKLIALQTRGDASNELRDAYTAVIQGIQALDDAAAALMAGIIAGPEAE